MLIANLEWFLAAASVGYLLGSLPFGLIFTRIAGLGDVRQMGSGNIGATNVLRTGNKKIAAATLLADMLKGTIAVMIFSQTSIESETLPSIAAASAFLGHLFPLWLRFKGGKGVATYLGILLALTPWAALAFATVWLACAIISRYSSLSAILAVLVVGNASLGLDNGVQSFAIVAMSLIILIKHIDNIKRLIKGTESKINLSRNIKGT